MGVGKSAFWPPTSEKQLYPSPVPITVLKPLVLWGRGVKTSEGLRRDYTGMPVFVK